MNKFVDEIEKNCYFKFIFSSPFDKKNNKKVVFRRLEEDGTKWQCERFSETQVFHKNISGNEIKDALIDEFGLFKQCCLISESETVTAFNNKGVCSLKRVKTQNKCSGGHNRVKKYFINEGDDVPVMI